MKRKKTKKFLSIIIPIIILLIISILNMYGASFVSPIYKEALFRQVIWIIISLIIFILIYKLDIKFFYRNALLFYILGIISLILVLFMGKNVNGASSWFRIGSFSIQPSEIFKIFFLIFLARIIDKHKSGNFSLLFKVLVISLIPCLLIFLEPDTGIVIMYLLITTGELFASKIDKKIILFIMGIGVLFIGSFFLLYFLKKDIFIRIFGTSFFYRMDRLLSFKNNNSYQLTNALIGIGSSGIFGLGLTQQKIYVPELTTDFVFDLNIMNFGYIMGIFIIFLYVWLLINIYKTMVNSKKSLYKYILSGVMFMFVFQVFEHVFMNIGLTPITGITLPFLSYGGSSLLSYTMIFAIILKITTNNSSYN